MLGKHARVSDSLSIQLGHMDERKKSLKTRGKTEKRLPEVVISIGALVSRCHSYHSSPRSRRSVPRGYEDDIVGFQPDPLIVRRVAP